MLKSSGLYYEGGLSHLIAIILILLLTVMISIFSAITAQRTKKISPVRAIGMGLEPIYFSSKLNIKLEKMKGLQLDVLLAIKQVLTKPKQYIQLFIISLLFGFSLLFSLSLATLFNNPEAVSMFGSILADLEIDTATEEDAARLMMEIEADYDLKWITYEKTEQIIVEGDKVMAKISKDFNKTKELKLLWGRHVKHDNEIEVNSLLIDQWQKKIGDTLTVRIKGKEDFQYIIVGIYQSVDQVGKTVRILDTSMKQMNPDFELNEFYLAFQNKESLEEIIPKMREHYVGWEEISNQSTETLGLVKTVQTVFTAISRIVFVSTILMIGFITLLVMRITILGETTELGIYKALGVHANRLRLQLAIRFSVVTCVGSSFGIILSIIFGSNLFEFFIRQVGIRSVDMHMNLLQGLFTLLTISLMAFVSAFLSSGYTKKLTPYALIKE